MTLKLHNQWSLDASDASLLQAMVSILDCTYASLDRTLKLIPERLETCQSCRESVSVKQMFNIFQCGVQKRICLNCYSNRERNIS